MMIRFASVPWSASSNQFLEAVRPLSADARLDGDGVARGHVQIASHTADFSATFDGDGLRDVGLIVHLNESDPFDALDRLRDLLVSKYGGFAHELDGSWYRWTAPADAGGDTVSLHLDTDDYEYIAIRYSSVRAQVAFEEQVRTELEQQDAQARSIL